MPLSAGTVNDSRGNEALAAHRGMGFAQSVGWPHFGAGVVDLGGGSAVPPTAVPAATAVLIPNNQAGRGDGTSDLPPITGRLIAPVR